MKAIAITLEVDRNTYRNARQRPPPRGVSYLTGSRDGFKP